MSTYTAQVSWDRSKQDLRAHTLRAGGQTVLGSMAAERGGDPERADPEVLLVGSAAACHMLWFLDFSRRERLRVTSYEDDAEGTMDETRFTRIVLRPRIEFDSEVDAETLASLHHRAHEHCFIANSLNCPVEVEAA